MLAKIAYLIQRGLDALTCESCGENPLRTNFCCGPCERALCAECAGAGRINTCTIIECVRCQLVKSAGTRTLSSGDSTLDQHRLLLLQGHTAALTQLRQDFLRGLTTKRHMHNLKSWTDYCQLMGVRAYPPAVHDLELFVAHALTTRQPVLDPASIKLTIGAISGYMIQLQRVGLTVDPPWVLENAAKSSVITNLVNTCVTNYKLPVRAKQLMSVEVLCEVLFKGFDNSTRYGLHQLVFFILSMCLPCRPGGVAHIKISYTVFGDRVCTTENSDIRFYPEGTPIWRRAYILVRIACEKNVTPDNPAWRPIPGVMLGRNIYSIIHDYVLTQRPPSGGYMMVAPKSPQGKTFHDTPYTNFNPAFQKAVSRGLNGALDARDYGGGTPRKSFAQWMNATGVPRHVMADICGWSLRNRDAMDGYMKTTPEMVLRVKSSLPAPAYS